jgi:hypothetical protein
VDNTTTTTTSTAPDFNTLVIRRPTSVSGVGVNQANRIGFREIQVWVNGSNIMVNNNVSGYFALFANNQDDIGFTFSPELGINDIVEELTNNDTTLSASDSIDIALIYKDIPLTSVDLLEAFVFYNRTANDTGGRAIGLAIELYNSINDPNLTTALATTNVIENIADVYRFDFPDITTYSGGFSSGNSTTQIVDNTFALTENATISQGGATTTTTTEPSFIGSLDSNIINVLNINPTKINGLPAITTIAIAKVDSTGSSLKAIGCSTQRTSTGKYTFTFNTPTQDTNYVVQLTTFESSTSLGAILVSVNENSTTTTGFQYSIHEQDNGTTAGVLRDRQHFVSVFDAF